MLNVSLQTVSRTRRLYIFQYSRPLHYPHYLLQGWGRFPEKQSPRLNERTIILATGRLNGTESLDFEATDLSWMG